MRFLSATRRLVIMLLVSSAIACLGQYAPPPVQQHLELPDPTPRPEDIKQKYESIAPNPDMSARAIALRRAQNREQIQKATNMLVMLAQRLRDNPGSTTAAPTLAVSAQRASEIEVLAKIIRDRMRLQ
jgi:outer membrane biosynthesis protein TonB